jgi:anti-sigma regulatory factor (Ser/Thr protein kinase)
VALADAPDTVPPFLHEAFFYADEAEYLSRTIPFVQEGLDRGEPVLVALPARNVELLQPCFGPAAASLLRFAAMEDLGRNPAWIIPAWRDFVAPHAAAGRTARGIGEPIWASRTPDELVECGRHEALLNLAFADAAGFTLLCPYDLSSLTVDILDEAHRNHPHVSDVGGSNHSTCYLSDVPDWLDTPLAPVPVGAREVEFDRTSLSIVRHLVAQQANAAGLRRNRVDDLVLAVGEAMANSLMHGGGTGRATLWHDEAAGRFSVEVCDHGRITDPLAGRVKPQAGSIGGRGLWLIHQLCDLVQLRAVPEGQLVRLHVTT